MRNAGAARDSRELQLDTAELLGRLGATEAKALARGMEACAEAAAEPATARNEPGAIRPVLQCVCL